MRARPHFSARALALVIYALLVVVACVLVAFGASMLMLLGLVFVAAIVALRARMALAPALALLFVAFIWATLMLFVLGRYSHIPLLALVIIAALASAGIAGWSVYRGPIVWTRADSSALALMSTGGIIWVGVLGAASILPSGAPVSWATMGDAANNVLFARSVLEAGGISIGGAENPVPVTATLVTLFTLPGTLAGAPGVEAQILSLAQMWSFGIVAACVLSGAFASALIRRRSAIGLTAVAVSSCVPLSWLALSGPVVLGFVNFHLTLALLLVPLILLAVPQRAFLTSFVGACLAMGSALALWAPTAVIPGVAFVLVCIQGRRRLFALRGGRLIIAIGALAQPILFFFLQSLPSLAAGGTALQGALGAVFEFRKSIAVGLAAVVVALAVLHLRAMRSNALVLVAVSVLGGGGAAMGALLWLRRHEASLWSYYQLKLLWFLIALMMIVVVAAGLSLAVAFERRAAAAATAVVGTLAVVLLASGFAQMTVPTFSRDADAVANPLSRILAGRFYSVGQGDRVFHRIVELTEADDRTVLWLSTDPDEDYVMFWVTQMAAKDINDIPLRKMAYYRDKTTVADLCRMRELMGPPVDVITHNAQVVEDVARECPGLGTVHLE